MRFMWTLVQLILPAYQAFLADIILHDMLCDNQLQICCSNGSDSHREREKERNSSALLWLFSQTNDAQ